jgi:AraC-like DNA-binding protein
VSNALPLSMTNVTAPSTQSAPRPAPRSGWGLAPNNRPLSQAPNAQSSIGLRPGMPAPRLTPLQRIAPPPPAPAIPRTTPERMMLARERIRAAAEAGQRIRSYEVALDLDLSEFHFARQFRAAFGRSPHVFYDEIRAERARALLREGMGEGEVARRVGFRRPAELRALLSKRCETTTTAAPTAAT